MLNGSSLFVPRGSQWLRLMIGMVLLGVAGCASHPAPPISGPFDGIWTSPQSGYDFLLNGRTGRVVYSGRAEIHVNDEVFQLLSLDEAMRFTARQLMPDGIWHEVTGELKADGKLYCSDGKTTWVIERKPHHEIG